MSRTEPLPFAMPWLGEEEINEVVETLRSGWITTGPRSQKFAVEFARVVDAPAALGVNSCTAALHLALIAAGVGQGDRVITSPMTFASTVNVIEHVGATPVFVDVEPDTLNLDPAQVAAVLEGAEAPRVGSGPARILMPVHYAGHPVDMDPILELAAQHGAGVIEDAAHALPARYRGRSIGNLDGPDIFRVAAFSFYANKNLTTGEGGMFVANPEVVDEARVLSMHGMSRDAWKRYEAEGAWFYEVTAAGWKYNMTDVAAALGLQQLRKLEMFHRRRQEIVARYHDAFTDLDAVQAPTERPDVEHAWHLYVLRLHLDRMNLDRRQFIHELGTRMIGTSVHFIPVHMHPFYRDRYGYEPEDFPIAFGEYQRVVSLPLYPAMSDVDVDDVIEAVRDICTKHRR